MPTVSAGCARGNPRAPRVFTTVVRVPPTLPGVRCLAVVFAVAHVIAGRWVMTMGLLIRAYDVAGRCRGVATRVHVLEAEPAEADPRPDLDLLRSQLARLGDALDGLLFAARDATSEAPICPRAAQRADIDRFDAEIRARLDALSALITEEPR